MAEKLTPEKIEEIAKNYEKITQGKLPIIKGDKEEVTAKIDPKILQAKKEEKRIKEKRRQKRNILWKKQRKEWYLNQNIKN